MNDEEIKTKKHQITEFNHCSENIFWMIKGLNCITEKDKKKRERER